MANLLPVIQIVVSAVLIALILLQQRGTALGSSFGGEGGFYSARRGAQKRIYWATIVFAVLFIALAISNLIF